MNNQHHNDLTCHLDPEGRSSPLSEQEPVLVYITFSIIQIEKWQSLQGESI